MYNPETDSTLHPAHKQALAIMDRNDPIKAHNQVMRVYARYVVSSEIVKEYSNGIKIRAYKDKDGVTLYEDYEVEKA